MSIAVGEVLTRAGTGRFQRRPLGVFGLVGTADAMQVLAVGFAAPSAAATFGLSLARALQAGTAFFLGLLLGAAGFGRLADRVGRRRALLVTVALDGAFGLMSAFAPSFGALPVLRRLTGAAVGGTLPVGDAMMAEFLPPRSRGRWLVTLEGFWAVGAGRRRARRLGAVGGGRGGGGLALAAGARRRAGADRPPAAGLGPRIPPPPAAHGAREEEARAGLGRVLAVNGRAPIEAGERLAPPVPEGRTGLLAPGLRRRTLLILAV